MKLGIKKFKVRDVFFHERSKYENGILYINIKEFEEIILEGIDDFKIHFDIAKPSESTRIIHVMDTVKPAYKPEGSSFPGWLSETKDTGVGITHQLENVTIMQTCKFPGVQEGIIDMSGEGSKYSVFSKKINIVMNMEIINKDIEKAKFAYDVKVMILRAAEYLAKLTENSSAFTLENYELKEYSGDLPKIGYVYYIQAQGNLRNVHVYGEDNVTMGPVMLHPNEILDGALISANYIIACQKNPSYFHQENPIVKNLYDRHGKELDFVGVFISTESSKLDEKKNNAFQIAKLASKHNLDGIIISQEGGGHADVDLMLSLEECEKLGIKGVIVTNEIAGEQGDLPPLVSYSNMADAIISNGNNDCIITLDKVDKVIGGNEILNGKFIASDSFITSLGIVYTSTNQLGMNKMTTFNY